MDDIIQKAADLYAALQTKSAILDKEKAAVAKKSNETAALVRENDARRIDLDARETEVRKVEDIQKLRDDSRTAKAEAVKARTELQNDRTVFRSESEATRKLISDERAKLTSERALCRKEYDQLNLDKKRLAEDRRTFKQKVLDEVRLKVGA